MDVSLKGIMNTVTLAIYHYRTQEPVGGSIVVCGSTMGIQRCRAVDYGEFYINTLSGTPSLLFSKA